MTAIPEKDSPDKAPVRLETDNQDKTPINQDKEPEIAVNPLITGFTVNQEPEIPKKLLRGITGAELAKRLGVEGSTISRQSSKPDFAEWCKNPKTFSAKGNKLPDPNGWGWEKRRDRYFPIIEKD